MLQQWGSHFAQNTLPIPIFIRKSGMQKNPVHPACRGEAFSEDWSIRSIKKLKLESIHLKSQIYEE